jgi:alkylhydroperoxidase family enzyme
VFLSDPPEDPVVRALYEQSRAEDGYVMNLLRVWAWRPDVNAAFMGARKALVAQTTLSKREIAVLNAATAARRGDAYCSIAWGSRIAELADADTAAALLGGEETPRLSEREIALARWAELVVRDANAAARGDWKHSVPPACRSAKSSMRPSSSRFAWRSPR